jgi:hypothetical protein
MGDDSRIQQLLDELLGVHGTTEASWNRHTPYPGISAATMQLPATATS